MRTPSRIQRITIALKVFSLLKERKDFRWFSIWLVGMFGLWIWDILFLNTLSYDLLQVAIFHTFIGGVAAITIAMALGWGGGIVLYFLENGKIRIIFYLLLFVFNLLRSIPQIIGMLIGYIVLTLWLQHGIQSPSLQILWMSLVIGIFCSLEVVDLVRERIAYFKTSDYFPAMQSCGMKESRILNVEILMKSSLSHLFHKFVSLFGVAIFLQCSIDFVISVGLSNDVSLTNFPVTLGSLLAKLDSKQDILALGSVLLNPSYFSHIFFQHLQGVSVACIIVFTLICIYHIADGLVQYYDL